MLTIKCSYQKIKQSLFHSVTILNKSLWTPWDSWTNRGHQVRHPELVPWTYMEETENLKYFYKHYMILISSLPPLKQIKIKKLNAIMGGASALF